mmetsp:Transcript_31037/g.83330  ORF Transcript_31037/g.83330 Transcript_31037/m.83330 type:complete len:275 (-) Transcript_31037:196-1020(-)
MKHREGGHTVDMVHREGGHTVDMVHGWVHQGQGQHEHYTKHRRYISYCAVKYEAKMNGKIRCKRRWEIHTGGLFISTPPLQNKREATAGKCTSPCRTFTFFATRSGGTSETHWTRWALGAWAILGSLKLSHLQIQFAVLVLQGLDRSTIDVNILLQASHILEGDSLLATVLKGQFSLQSIHNLPNISKVFLQLRHGNTLRRHLVLNSAKSVRTSRVWNNVKHRAYCLGDRSDRGGRGGNVDLGGSRITISIRRHQGQLLGLCLANLIWLQENAI